MSFVAGNRRRVWEVWRRSGGRGMWRGLSRGRCWRGWRGGLGGWGEVFWGGGGVVDRGDYGEGLVRERGCGWKDDASIPPASGSSNWKPK